MDLPDGLIISVSGIRGRVGVDINPAIVAEFAAAFGSFARAQGWGQRLAIARDSRPSGPAFVRAATAGMQAVGCHVSDLGLVPTPTALLEIEGRRLAGGIVVTASHNPAEWNALKLASPDGAFLRPERGREFLAGLKAGKAPAYVQYGFGAVEQVRGTAERHLQGILNLDLIDRDRIAEHGFKVVLDCTRGAGGVIVPELLTRLGCEVVGLDLEPDGRFTREPEPIPANLVALCRRVPEVGADLGLAVDPDADRLALVDETGVAIGEDYTLALATKLVLSHRRGPVVANLSTSQIVATMAREADVEYHQSPVGEANVAALMRQVDAVVGGEGNGGVILPALHLTRDAPLGVALVLQLLAEEGASLGTVVARYPQFIIVKERFLRPDRPFQSLAEELEKAFDDAEIDRSDGLQFRWSDRRTWLHCRPSGTEPILRVVAEGPREAEAEVRERVRKAGAVLERAS